MNALKLGSCKQKACGIQSRVKMSKYIYNPWWFSVAFQWTHTIISTNV